MKGNAFRTMSMRASGDPLFGAEASSWAIELESTEGPELIPSTLFAVSFALLSVFEIAEGPVLMTSPWLFDCSSSTLFVGSFVMLGLLSMLLFW